MRNKTAACLAVILLTYMSGYAMGRMTQQEAEAKSKAHIAAIQPKIIGKWQTKDKKKYIEFSADGSCSEGSLWDDGKWHVDKGKLWAYPEGHQFSCNSGALDLTGQNVIVRDYGMGGDVERYYRVGHTN